MPGGGVTVAGSVFQLIDAWSGGKLFCTRVYLNGEFRQNNKKEVWDVYWIGINLEEEVSTGTLDMRTRPRYWRKGPKGVGSSFSLKFISFSKEAISDCIIDSHEFHTAA